MHLPRIRSTRRYVRIGFAVLLLVSAAQAGWWILDQWLYSGVVRARVVELAGEQVAAARALLEAGVAPERVRALLPNVELDGGGAQIDPQLLERFDAERSHRMNRYFWEGGFFLFVLLTSVGVIVRALRHDAELRRRQQNFLAAVSHELKSPLAGARIAAETLELRDPSPEHRRRYVHRVLRNIGRLESMVSNLLDTVRLEEGQFVMRPAPVEPAAALAPVIEAFAAQATEEGVEFRVDTEPGIQVTADVQALRLVVRNLLENAFKAVEGSQQPRVTLHAAADGEFVRLDVIDNGVGFSPAEGRRLFQKFYRPGDEMRRGGRGAGLGLHIVRLAVERSGGRVGAASPGAGRGATFSVFWPRAASAAPAERPARQRPGASAERPEDRRAGADGAGRRP